MSGKSTKTHKCKHCGETNIVNFRFNSKSTCNTCQNIKNKLRQRNDPNRSLYYKTNLFKIKLQMAFKRAEKKGLKSDLTLKELEDQLQKQDNRCIYTGLEFNNDNPNYSVSIDRIDPTLGYTKDNIQLVCSIVNIMKLNLPEEEFKHIICLIYENMF